MNAIVADLTRHPVKGFTPEHLQCVDLRVGEGFPFDRAFAVEDGPSGFDPSAPAHVPKMKFTVLAKIPAVALVRTCYDDVAGVFHAEAPHAPPIAVRLSEESERRRFASWLGEALKGHVAGPLRVLPAPGTHRFYDHPQGLVSLINLESVRDIERRIVRRIDPLRFRANIYVSGLPAWDELDSDGRTFRLGEASARVFKSITRCAATHVDLETGMRDIDMVDTLRREYGHTLCGVYLHVDRAGVLELGDRVEMLP